MTNSKFEIMSNCVNDMIECYEDVCITSERSGNYAREHSFLLKIMYEYARINNLKTKKKVTKLNFTTQQKSHFCDSYHSYQNGIKRLKKENSTSIYLDELKFLVKIMDAVAKEHNINLD